jgi:Zn-dependent protease with chaperone function
MSSRYLFLLLLLSAKIIPAQQKLSLSSGITQTEKAIWATATILPFVLKGIRPYLTKKSHIGHKPLSAEWEAKTRAILQDMGMKNWQTVPLYKVNKVIPTNQAYPCFGFGNALFIDETSAKKLSEQEFRFLIGHEASHIIYNDSTTKSYFLTLMPCIFYGISAATSELIQLVYKKQTSYRFSDTALRIDYGARTFATLIATKLSYLAFYRYQEARADKTSIETLDCPAGCIETFENLKKKYPQEPDPLLHSHPCYADRIKMAQEYQKKHTIITP